MDRLRKRRDFLAAAKAQRAGVACFLLQGRDRGDGGAVRVGFTVTKKTGNAVVRNRIRRRLREAARQVLPQAGQAGHDYVLIARENALKAPFAGLVGDLERAMRKLHAPARPRAGSGAGSAGSGGDHPPGARRPRRRPEPDPSPAPVRAAPDSAPQAPDPQAPTADGGHPA